LALAGLALAGCRKREAADGAPQATSPIPAREAPSAGSGGDGQMPRDKSAHPGFNERVDERNGLVGVLQEDGIVDPRVLAAMRRVPRHWFVPEGYRGEAYANRPLPIGHGQTISQPYIVAAMTEAVLPRPGERCLEIGTGSGYQAAVLAELCDRVFSIEYLPEVARFGEENLRRLGYGPERVALRVGDGYRGWPEHAPFDVIVVTAAPERIPRPLLEQLAVGGRLIIPVGPEQGAQELEIVRRVKPGMSDDAFERRTLMGVRFVPFLGDGADEN
jgi:protein-L-isoaspartate(D-aspartate) O-methyltransferase